MLLPAAGAALAAEPLTKRTGAWIARLLGRCGGGGSSNDNKQDNGCDRSCGAKAQTSGSAGATHKKSAGTDPPCSSCGSNNQGSSCNCRCRRRRRRRSRSSNSSNIGSSNDGRGSGN
jgi:hypothetical protein